MEVHLGGHLAFYNRAKRARFEMHLESEAALLDVIREPGIPEAEIAMAAVNRTVVSLPEARVGDADRLDLYPPDERRGTEVERWVCLCVTPQAKPPDGPGRDRGEHRSRAEARGQLTINGSRSRR